MTRYSKKPGRTNQDTPKSQSQRFIDKARELGADEDEGRFKEKLRRIARADVPPEDRKKPKGKG